MISEQNSATPERRVDASENSGGPPRAPTWITRELAAERQCYYELWTLFTAGEVDLEVVAEIIGRSNRVTARVLRHVNSLRHGLHVKVIDARHAVLMLGIRGVRDLCASHWKSDMESSPSGTSKTVSKGS